MAAEVRCKNETGSRYPQKPVRLADLPPLLRDEPALTRALGEPDARLAVVEVARPIAIAALAGLSGRRPLVVACPTGTMAAQLADDLAQFLPAGQVATFPAWETLPFERVSPSVETMGRRLELLWRLRDPGDVPGGDRHRRPRPAPAPRSRRHRGRRRSPCAPATSSIPTSSSRRLVEFGYRREELVEHRGEFARRGAIVDVFPATADGPIRIDLWGDEVDRLTTFGVNDQRSTGDLAEALIFPARELIPTDDVRARAAKLVAAEPWGREQWERLAEGALFDGMESWLPWLVDDDHERAAHRRPARVGQGRPRRAAADARPGDRPARRGGRPGEGAGVDVGPRPDVRFPRLHAEPGPPARRPSTGAVLVDRLVAGVAGHAGRAGVGVGPGRRRRLPGS